MDSNSTTLNLLLQPNTIQDENKEENTSVGKYPGSSLPQSGSITQENSKIRSRAQALFWRSQSNLILCLRLPGAMLLKQTRLAQEKLSITE